MSGETKIKLMIDNSNAKAKAKETGEAIKAAIERATKGIDSKALKDLFSSVSNSMGGVSQQLLNEQKRTAKSLVDAKKQLDKAIKENIAQDEVNKLKDLVKTLSEQHKKITDTINNTKVQNISQSLGQGLTGQGGSIQSLLTKGLSGLFGSGGSGGGLGGMLGGMSGALVAGGVAAIAIGTAKKLWDWTKEGAQYDKEADVYSAKVSQKGRYFNDDKVTSSANFGVANGFNRVDTLKQMDEYISYAGSQSLSSLRDDVNAMQKGSNALGIDYSTLASNIGDFNVMGIAKDGDASKILGNVLEIANATGMKGRDDEVLEQLHAIADNTYKTQLNMNSSQLEAISDATINFSKALGITGDKSSEILSGLNGDIMNANGKLDRVYGWGTKYQGSEGWLALKMREEEGIANPENLTDISNLAKREGWDDSVYALKLKEYFPSLSYTQANELAKSDALATVTDPNASEEDKQKALAEIEKNYGDTEASLQKSIEANVQDIKTILGDVWNNLKGSTLGAMMGLNDVKSAQDIINYADVNDMSDEDLAKMIANDSIGKSKDEILEDIQAYKDGSEHALDYVEDMYEYKNGKLVNKGGEVLVAEDSDAYKEEKEKNKENNKDKADGSFALGLDYVPHDNYLANLHEGEMILPKSKANMLRGNNSSSDAQRLAIDKMYNIIGKEEENNDETDTLLEKRKSLVDQERINIENLAEIMGMDINVESKSGSESADATSTVSSDGNIGSLDTSNWKTYDLNGISQSGGDPTHGLSEDQVNAYLNSKAKPGSTMYNQGKAFIQASKESGLDIYYLIAHAATETGWGSSNISKSKGNMYGIGAFDNSPYQSAYGYDSSGAGIIEGAKWIAEHYANGKYNQDTLYKMRNNNGVHEYATDPQWDETIANIMGSTAKALGGSSSVSAASTTNNTTINNNVTINAKTNASAKDIANETTNNLNLNYAYTQGLYNRV